jgi:putative transposase
MKKSTKSKRPRQPRSPRSSRKRKQVLDGRVVDVREQIREALMVDVRSAVAMTAGQLVEDEAATSVGEPWSRKGESPLRRNGRTTTTIFLDGEPHLLQRPRIRDQDVGSEYPLQTVRALRSRDALDEDVKTRMVRGVSTRNYEDTLTTLSDGLGLKKSAVSSAFQRAAQKDLDALNGRSLAEWTFTAIYIDGTSFADHTCVIAMGLESDGTKRILGVVEGATENTELVRDLLANLEERGLQTTKRVLFVIDGSKALRKAIRDVFGRRALVQRCQLHKRRNIESYLPPSRQAEARRRLNAAWGMSRYDDALQELRRVCAWLKALAVVGATLQPGTPGVVSLKAVCQAQAAPPSPPRWPFPKNVVN